MRNPDPRHPSGAAAGFALPATLVVVGGLLILAVGILLLAGIERGTARSYVDRSRAELAARAGLEDLRGLLATEAANDEFLVLQSKLTAPIDATKPDAQPAPFLFLSRANASGATYTWRHVPLFSSVSRPAEAPLAAPAVESLLGSTPDERVDFTAQPWFDKVRVAWLPVHDDKGRIVARYAYWVEDLQARLDPKLAGNADAGGSHGFNAYPQMVAGVNLQPPSATEPALDQVPLFAFDPAAGAAAQGQLGKTLMQNRGMLVSPGSPLAAAGFTPPLQRLTSKTADPTNPALFGLPGELADPAARAVEQGLHPGIRPYREQPLVPFADGIAAAAAGQPKLNLNRLLKTGGDAAVGEMAAFIRKALPDFEQRKGGFPEDYLKTLAANALDYADDDSDPTVREGQYRGLDAVPLVSEFLMRFRWENVLTEGGRKYLVLSASTYVELWNLTDRPVAGNAELTYETGYLFPLGANPEVSLADLADATPQLAQADGHHWFPPVAVTLKPNEYRVIRCGTVTYKIDAGPASVFIPSPLVLEGETFGTSKAGYRMKWNGTLVDQSRGGLHRNNSSLNYPTDTAGQPRQRVRTTVPSHSHTRNGSFRNNMGDPRMSYYNEAPQDANAYPDNYSPNRRNIRFGTIYKSDGATKTKVYGRVMPSEWPDGGHNSSCESSAFYTEDQRVLPDDNRFVPGASSVLRNPPVEEAPMRLSNLGRFYSATELGRVYDPVMWEIAAPAGANLPWGDIRSNSIASSDFGGGNTLRIGRPEHPRFDGVTTPGTEAWRLLDLFHAGISRSENAAEREGPLQSVEGAVNLNTASREVLRVLAFGSLKMDPKISVRTSETHQATSLMAPPVTEYKPSDDELRAEANRIADAIVEARKVRPFTSAAAVAAVLDPSGKPAFGNKDLLRNGTKIHRSDAASEETFARVHEASTVRSRNFRVWVVGQAISPVASLSAKPQVLAEVRKSFTVFADPGERKPDGTIDPAKSRLTILHETDF